MEDEIPLAYGNKYELDTLATPNKGPHVVRKHSDKKEKSEKENGIATRTPFQRDKDRIVYSKAFR
ncbi:hypothetical protein FXV91_17355 [Methanosarcina sp. DH2]|uniref:hypothetical protein n=1 Tax=Methanosarcina sp. DH2 TaxID=2605639 RepID=UPI001E61C4D5|nr:hypothetical protein [Methanosarcina sp. DH2]MCC4771865.1 hypothetical protein [Methanosarcina sp. DH2]